MHAYKCTLYLVQKCRKCVTTASSWYNICCCADRICQQLHALFVPLHPIVNETSVPIQGVYYTADTSDSEGYVFITRRRELLAASSRKYEIEWYQSADNMIKKDYWQVSCATNVVVHVTES